MNFQNERDHEVDPDQLVLVARAVYITPELVRDIVREVWDSVSYDGSIDFDAAEFGLLAFFKERGDA